MSNTTYTMANPFDWTVLRHWPLGHTTVVCDGADDRTSSDSSYPARWLELEAHVRSGDYVATLATRLDQLTESQPNTPEKAQLETVVSELLYIDNRYKLAKK